MTEDLTGTLLTATWTSTQWGIGIYADQTTTDSLVFCQLLLTAVFMDIVRILMRMYWAWIGYKFFHWCEQYFGFQVLFNYYWSQILSSYLCTGGDNLKIPKQHLWHIRWTELHTLHESHVSRNELWEWWKSTLWSTFSISVSMLSYNQLSLAQLNYTD